MKAELNIRGRRLVVDFSAGHSIAIPLDPHGAQPSFFTDQPATATPLESGDFFGKVAGGGSCNAEVLSFTPHCHGTHTECMGHITHDAGVVQEMIYPGPVVALLVSLAGDPGQSINRDRVETAVNLGCEALVIRTLPNNAEKCSRNYADQPAYPVLPREAMLWLSNLSLKHLLIDTPSIDAADDGGVLANHRTWWLPQKPPNRILDPARRSITEMIYVENDIPDGEYWLQLELSPIHSDATPSRPILYPMETK
jgi:kynurenine formamidase